MGAKLLVGSDYVKVTPSELKAIKVETMPYPGFPTDLQAQLVALCLTARGTSLLRRKYLKIGLCISLN